MKGDFSRMTFDPRKHFSRVLMQQGRVQLDADWNEQVDILLHYMRTLAIDLRGPFWGPPNSFAITERTSATTGRSSRARRQDPDFLIGPGRYYVDGILAENEPALSCGAEVQPLAYTDQPAYRYLETLERNRQYLVYLDVWERHVSYLEDEDATGDYPSIREVALGEVDTATRARVVWQVKTTGTYWERREDQPVEVPIPEEDPADGWPGWVQDHWQGWMDGWQPAYLGCLSARAKTDPGKAINPCLIDPEAGYRGLENQLYRVEIHRPGGNGEATFKWSRDNGSVIFPISGIGVSGDSTLVTLGNLGRDGGLGLKEGDWVEIVDDEYVLGNRAEPLLRVQSVDMVEKTVELIGSTAVMFQADLHPLLRRWDQKAAEVPVTQGDWQSLEDGIAVSFQPDGETSKAMYRTGDYWLIPARTATGDVEWPGTTDEPRFLPPHGVEHHFAPLAILKVDTNGKPAIMGLHKWITPP